MAHPLAYECIQTFDLKQQEEIQASLDILVSDYQWWSEETNLKIVNSNKISGSSKLFQLGSSDESKEDDPQSVQNQALRVKKDLDKIVADLVHLAKKYELTWNLSISDKQLGTIDSSGATKALVETFRQMFALAKPINETPKDEEEEPASYQTKNKWWKFW